MAKQPDVAEGTKQENHIITSLEKYMTKEATCSRERVIIAEELDLIFSKQELKNIAGMINRGKQPGEIAETLGRELQEILHAFIHLTFHGQFKLKKKLVLSSQD